MKVTNCRELMAGLRLISVIASCARSTWKKWGQKKDGPRSKMRQLRQEKQVLVEGDVNYAEESLRTIKHLLEV